LREMGYVKRGNRIKSDFEQNEDKNTIQLCSIVTRLWSKSKPENDYDTNLFKSGNYF